MSPTNTTSTGIPRFIPGLAYIQSTEYEERFGTTNNESAN